MNARDGVKVSWFKNQLGIAKRERENWSEQKQNGMRSEVAKMVGSSKTTTRGQPQAKNSSEDSRNKSRG